MAGRLTIHPSITAAAFNDHQRSKMPCRTGDGRAKAEAKNRAHSASE